MTQGEFDIFKERLASRASSQTTNEELMMVIEWVEILFRQQGETEQRLYRMIEVAYNSHG